MTEVRFDDIPALEALVSEEFGTFGEPLTVSQEMINAFAELTGDRQWIHIDIERAKAESPFGTTIAHGFLLVSLIPVLKDGNQHKIVGQASTINYGADKLRFISPVPAGSKIQARRRLAAVTAKKKGTQVTSETEVYVVGSEKPAMLYRSLALLLPA